MSRTTTSPSTASESAEALDRFERGAIALMRRLADRGTLGDIARRTGHELSPVSWRLLEHLHATGPKRVSDIAACHGVDVSSVTPRLQGLESAGLIERGTDPLDARVSIISLSAGGRRAVESVCEARREILARALHDAEPSAVLAAADVMLDVAEQLADGAPER